MNLPDISGASLLLTDGTSIPFEASFNAGLVIWSIGSYIASSLTQSGASRLKDLTIAVIQAFAVSAGCWACLLLQSRWHVNSLSASGVSLAVNLQPELVSLSVVIPFLATMPMHLVLKRTEWLQSNGRSFIAITATGANLGMFLGFIPILLLWSTAQFTTTYNPVRLVLSLLLTMSASILASGTPCLQDMGRIRKRTRHTVRLVIALVFGAAVTGADILFISGLVFTSRETVVLLPARDARESLNVLTLGTPAVVTGLLLVIQLVLACFRSRRLSSDPRKPTRVILASISVSEDGRVLVNNRNTLFVQEVSYRRGYSLSPQDFDVHGSLFQWLFSESRGLSSSLGRGMPEMARGSDNQKSKYGIFELLWKRRIRHDRSTDFAYSKRIMRHRLFSAATALADDLEIPVSELGQLHYGTLRIDSTVGLSEFLDLSENAAQGCSLVDIEATLQRSVDQCDGEGIMLFFVRTLPRTQSALASSQRCIDSISKDGSSSFGPQRYLPHGCRLRRLSGRFYNCIAQDYNANAAHTERILVNCVNQAASVEDSILKVGGTHITLFHERVGIHGKEVLVYEYAQHQTPACLVHYAPITAEVEDWLECMQGSTAFDLLEVCRVEFLQKGCQKAKSDALPTFKRGLFHAIDSLCQELSFIGKDIILQSVLSPRISRKPVNHLGSKSCNDGYDNHAWVITFDVADLKGSCPGSKAYSECHLTNSDVPSRPQAFTFIPSTIFEAMQVNDISDKDHDNMDLCPYIVPVPYVPNDAATLCAAPRFKMHPEHNLLHRQRLVSSFSIDTEDDESGGFNEFLRRLSSRIRHSAAFATVASQLRKSLSFPRDRVRRSRSRDREISSSTKSLRLSHQASSSSFSSTTTAVTQMSRDDYQLAHMTRMSVVNYGSQEREAEVFGFGGAYTGLRAQRREELNSNPFYPDELSMGGPSITFTFAPPPARLPSLPAPALVRGTGGGALLACKTNGTGITQLLPIRSRVQRMSDEQTGQKY